jgi:hypothetical protein
MKSFRSHRRNAMNSGFCMRGIVSALLLGSSLFGMSAASAAEKSFGFDVEISLSPKAAARLAKLSEGIIVSASYSGDPVPSAQKHADQIGRIDLGREQVETPGKAGTVHITGDKVHRERLAWIQGPVLLNVNVYSARHSGPDNILDCDFFDGNLQDAVGKSTALHCALIEEKTQPKAFTGAPSP